MVQEDLNNAVEIARKFYKDNNLPIPNSVVEYIKVFPKGMSRQALQKAYDIKCSEFVKLLNPTYEKPKDAASRALIECKRLGYTILSDISILTNNRDSINLQCNLCGNTHTTTITSLSGSVLGCPKCKSGNLPWNKRSEELDILLLDKFECSRVSSIPESQNGLITIKHIICGTEYTTQLVGLTHPTSPKRGTCPNCRPSDRRVVYEGITFGSQFELECYQILKPFNPEVHVEYSKFISTKRKWVCDFKVRNYWIEVSNFKQDFKGYFKNIEEKQEAIEASGFYFFFITSLQELKEFVSLI